MENESHLFPCAEDHTEKLLLLQRLIRSHYVRRQFEQVRQDYLQTLSDIEGTTMVQPVPIQPRKQIDQVDVKTTPRPLVVAHPTREELLHKREDLAIELLWIEQAIQSRKDYLRLKSRYTSSVS